jgi:4-amino-4-deoxy-L-arabinose transferase-like glycosyltransferase
MAETYKKYIYILGLCFIIFSGIYSGSKYMNVDLMEARNFVTAREMVQNNNWLLPTMNGEPRIAKPPLPTWATALAMKISGTDDNLAANRLPAGFAALLMVGFIYLTVNRMSGSRETGVYAAIVLSTSYMFMYMARKGTWDIFCHSFMLGAVWLYIVTFTSRKKKYLTSISAGVLMGLSWLSKGPVSFYALLLPFLISHAVIYRQEYTGDLFRHFAVMALVCLAVSTAWPLYVYTHMPAELHSIVKDESQAWFSRHIKPFWYYLQFPAMSGIWVFIILPMMWPSYAYKKIGKNKNYQMLLLWTVIMVILLAVIPEKKDRYLLPVTIPMAVIVSYYLRYLVNAFKKEVLSRSDRLIINMYMALTVLISLLVTASVIYAYTRPNASDNDLIMLAIALVSNYAAYRSIRLRSGTSYIHSVVITFIVLINVVPPLAQEIIPNKDFVLLHELRTVLTDEKAELYSDNDNMKLVWAVGQNIIRSGMNELKGSADNRSAYFLSEDEKLSPETNTPGVVMTKVRSVDLDGKPVWTLYKLNYVHSSL